MNEKPFLPSLQMSRELQLPFGTTLYWRKMADEFSRKGEAYVLMAVTNQKRTHDKPADKK